MIKNSLRNVMNVSSGQKTDAKLSVKSEKKNISEIDFSVIIPMYNEEKNICRCIDSILDQNFTNYEILIIDDGSTDRSLSICEKIKKKNEKINIFTSSNKGVSSARNIGINKARGNWLIFVDADDVIKEDCLKTFFYGNHSVDISVANENLKDDKIELLDELARKYIINEMIDPHKDDKTFNGSVCSKAFKRSMIKNYGIYFDVNLIHGEDTIFNLIALKHAKNIRFIKKSVYNVYYNPYSATNIYQKRIIENDRIFLQKINRILLSYKMSYGNLFSAIVLNGLWICMNLDIANLDNIETTTINQRKSKLISIMDKEYYRKEVKNVSIYSKLLPFKKCFFLCVKYDLYFLAIALVLLKSKIKQKFPNLHKIQSRRK